MSILSPLTQTTIVTDPNDSGVPIGENSHHLCRVDNLNKIQMHNVGKQTGATPGYKISQVQTLSVGATEYSLGSSEQKKQGQLKKVIYAKKKPEG